MDVAWIIAMIDPNDPDCQAFAKEWQILKSLETMNRSNIMLRAVDVTDPESDYLFELELMPSSVRRKAKPPAIVLFGWDKFEATLYEGELEHSALNDFICTFCYDNHYLGFELLEPVREMPEEPTEPI